MSRTATASRIDAMSQAEPAECLNLVVTTSSGHSQRCGNLFCNTGIEPLNHGRWRKDSSALLQRYLQIRLSRAQASEGATQPSWYGGVSATLADELLRV